MLANIITTRNNFLIQGLAQLFTNDERFYRVNRLVMVVYLIICIRVCQNTVFKCIFEDRQALQPNLDS